MKWRENIAVKALAFTAAVAAFTATAIMGWYQMANFDALWSDAYYGAEGYTGGYARHQSALAAAGPGRKDHLRQYAGGQRPGGH